MQTEKGFKVYGQVDDATIKQMKQAMELPISAYGAIMADGHLGYGLPIGAVLATRGAVIPGGVGYDISCGMFAVKTDLLVSDLRSDTMAILHAIQSVVKIGLGQVYDKPQDHEIFDRPEWDEFEILREQKQSASHQLGTVGSGNHFIDLCSDERGVLWIMIHCGSRNVGHKSAQYFIDIAKKLVPDVQVELAYLMLDSQAGQDYWSVMQLCGDFAYAGREVIAKKVLDVLGARKFWPVHNHHNFAWKETHFGVDLIVHRKGATPADLGVSGVVPGSMGDIAYIVRGKADAESLRSCSHGAGRQLGRSQALGKKDKAGNWTALPRISRDEMDAYLAESGVTLLGGDVDEAPQAYKRIQEVMAAQAELVEPMIALQPFGVLMSPAKQER